MAGGDRGAARSPFAPGSRAAWSAPFIMVDELIYSELARSLADSRELLVRDVPSRGYGIVYPALISPAYAVFERLTDAYAAVKTLNALVMSLAAIPAYLLARRVVGQGLSLLAAVLAVSLPSLVYTGSVMTENAFYPVFSRPRLLLTLVLERPTVARQVALLLAVGRRGCDARAGRAFSSPRCSPHRCSSRCFRRRRPASRAPAVSRGSTRVVLGGRPRRRRRAARARPLALRSPRRVQHRRRVRLRPGRGASLPLYHVAELDLYLGVVPVAATIVLVGALALSRPAAAGSARDDARSRRSGSCSSCRRSPPSSRSGSRSGTSSSSRRSS